MYKSTHFLIRCGRIWRKILIPNFSHIYVCVCVCVCARARASVNKFTSLEKIKPDAGCRLIGGGGREEEQGQEQKEVHFTAHHKTMYKQTESKLKLKIMPLGNFSSIYQVTAFLVLPKVVPRKLYFRY